MIVEHDSTRRTSAGGALGGAEELHERAGPHVALLEQLAAVDEPGVLAAFSREPSSASKAHSRRHAQVEEPREHARGVLHVPDGYVEHVRGVAEAHGRRRRRRVCRPSRLQLVHLAHGRAARRAAVLARRERPAQAREAELVRAVGQRARALVRWQRALAQQAVHVPTRPIDP